jgi:hypothetical protein
MTAEATEPNSRAAYVAALRVELAGLLDWSVHHLNREERAQLVRNELAKYEPEPQDGPVRRGRPRKAGDPNS